MWMPPSSEWAAVPGNLNMELLLTYLNKQGLDVDFNVLGEVITAFMPLYEEHKWNQSSLYDCRCKLYTSKEVMSWVVNRAYSFNSIVRAVENKKNKVKDNARYPMLKSILLLKY